jgi:hypothetical protein
MRRILIVFCIALVGSALTCTEAWSQASAQISGTVRDQSGAVLPGVEVTATQTETGISRTTVTNETGSYVLPNLALGSYRLEAGLPGFRTYAQTGIVLQVNANAVINAVLEVGQVAETIEVQANATLVETRSVGIGQIVENQRILELPLNGRNAAELVLLAGAAVHMGTTDGRNFPNRLIISTGGSLGVGTNYTLDGIRHIDAYDGLAMPLPFPDALEEFKVETSGLSAQHGRGSSVGAVTKSGTNDIHGDLFEFVRNDLFNARQYFAPKGSTLKRNQFGGTVGGPVQKNKLFFFAGYQGTTVRQDPSDAEAFVPTAAMLAGDFTTAASPLCNAGRQITMTAPFVGNRIDPSNFSRAALNIAGRLPKSDDPCGRVVFGRKDDSNETQIVGRMDYQISDKHSLFGRHVFNKMEIIHPFTYTPDNILNTAAAGFDNAAHAFSVGSTYLVSTNMVNAFRLGASLVDVKRTGVEFFEFKDVGINVYAYIPKYMTLNVSGGGGGFNIGGGSQSASNFTTAYYQAADDLSITTGTHQIGFGTHIGHARTNVNAFAAAGTFTFNGQESGLGLGDFLRGRPSNFLQGDANRLYGRNTYFALYGQDVWKLTPRLTMNYGLRWVPVLPMKDMRDPVPSVMIFDEAKFRQGTKSTVFKNAPAGLTYHGDAGFPLSGNDVFKARWLNFGPRLGFAWDVQGDGRTSLRASYGLTFEEFPLQMRQGESIGQPPYGGNVNLPFPAGGLEDPWRGVPGGDPHPLRLTVDTPFPAFGVFQAQTPDIKPTYIGTWNITLQRQIASDWVASTSYIGSKTTHLWAQVAVNPSLYFFNGTATCTLPNGQTITGSGNQCSTVANTNQRRRLSMINRTEGQGIGRMGEYVFGGNQHYHGMLTSIQHQPRKGVAVTANYTLSHCVGDYAGRSARGVSLGNDETYQDATNRGRDRANCEMDNRHSFNLTSVAETPQFAGRTMRLLASGWRLSGIYRVNSGQFLTVTTNIDRALNDISAQRPNQVLPDLYKDTSKGPFTQYLNPAAFAQPDLGTLGNLGRVNIKNPGKWQFDMALSRVFQFRETQSLEFRAEAYNVTNSFRPGLPELRLNNNTFGQIRTSLEPRIMQFALKYIF